MRGVFINFFGKLNFSSFKFDSKIVKIGLSSARGDIRPRKMAR